FWIVSAAYSQQTLAPIGAIGAPIGIAAGTFASPGVLPQSLAGRNSDGDGTVSAGPVSEPRFDGKSGWKYVKVLAAEDMEGRETGSLGLRKAQEYVVDQMKQAGLEFVGAKGYYQPVQFVSRQIVERESSLELVHNGQIQSLTLGEDAI